MEAGRVWLRRAALVLGRPRDAFAALQDDSVDAAGDRQDVVVGLAFAGGVAVALATAGQTLEELDALELLVWVFVSGLSYGFIGYWLLGWGLSYVVPRLGGLGTRRRTRHVLAFALVPLVLALPAWFVSPPLLIPLGVWSAGLLLFGLHVVYAWSYTRAAVGLVLAVVWLGALALGLWSVLSLLGGGFE
jgi:hypothetical protein